MKSIESYTNEQIQKFEKMHAALRTYNQSLGTKSELPIPNFSDQEMSEYSRYRELLIAKQSEES